MNEFISSSFMVLVEVTIFSIIVLAVVAYKFKKKKIQRRNLVENLVEKLRNEESHKRDGLREMLTGGQDTEEDKIENSINTLIDCEKLLYSSLLPIFLDKDIDKISTCDTQVDRLIKQYREIVRVEVSEDDGGKESTVLMLREENKDLREKLAQARADLDASMRTIEGMMEEFANMYEGGKKEGEQRVKNEMFKLKQNLEKKVESPDDGEDEEIKAKDGDLDISDALPE